MDLHHTKISRALVAVMEDINNNLDHNHTLDKVISSPKRMYLLL